MIEFGIGGLTAQAPAGDPASSGIALREALDHAELAEEVGLDSAWVSEHHFIEDGYLPSPLVLLAAMAERTSRIRIGTQVLLAPLYSPIKLAEDAAVIDQLAGGRLALGLGLGYQDREYTAFGTSSSARVKDLVRCISTLRTAWAGDPVRIGDGADEVIVRPLPSATGGPPLLIGAIAEQGVRRAARMADGYVAPMMSVKGFRRRLEWIEDEGVADDFTVGIYIHAFVATKDAWGRAQDGIRYVEEQYGRWQQAHSDFDRFRTIDRSRIDEPPDHVVIGSVAEVADRLAEWCDVLRSAPGGGPRHLIVRLTYPGIAPEDQREAIRLFGEEVVPRLAEYRVG